MTRYTRRTRVRAPLQSVWAFHLDVWSLEAVTPGWMRLRVESVLGPDGEATDELEAGTTVRLSMRPFGVGPRTRWTSRIVERVRRERDAWFRDEMVEGPFPRWTHTHRFRAEGAGTVLEDEVEYALPLLPGALSALGWPAFELLFAHRHRRTAALLGRE